MGLLRAIAVAHFVWIGIRGLGSTGCLGGTDAWFMLCCALLCSSLLQGVCVCEKS